MEVDCFLYDLLLDLVPHYVSYGSHGGKKGGVKGGEKEDRMRLVTSTVLLHVSGCFHTLSDAHRVLNFN